MIILSDLSEVLINGFDGTEQRLANRYYREPADRADFIARFTKRRQEMNANFLDLMRNHITEDIYWQEFVESGDWPFCFQEIEEAFSENLRGVIPGTLDLYQRINRYPRTLDVTSHADFETGRPTICLTSDHISSRINELKAYHPEVFQLFSDEYWSCDMGAVKGDAKFFPEVLRYLGVSPREVIFIDDMQCNIAAAARVGITGIRFSNSIQLETVLREAYAFRFTPTGP